MLGQAPRLLPMAKQAKAARAVPAVTAPGPSMPALLRVMAAKAALPVGAGRRVLRALPVPRAPQR